MLVTRVYVGNLSRETSQDSLRSAFEAHALVDSATIITERGSNRPTGCGFVEMPGHDAARKAQRALDGSRLDGRVIRVDVAKERVRRAKPAADLMRRLSKKRNCW